MPIHNLLSWVHNLRKRHIRQWPIRRNPLPLRVEVLEDRVVPATITEVESNNLLTIANALSLTEEPGGSGFNTGLALGSIGTTTDVDYYRFTALAGDRVTVAGEGGSGNSSIFVELRSGSDTIIVQAGDTTSGRPQINNFTISADGTYYVKTRTNAGNVTLASYSMRVDVAHGFTSEVENNSTTATASSITLSPGSAGHAVGQVSGYVSTAADTDHFAMGNLRAGDVVDL